MSRNVRSILGTSAVIFALSVATSAPAHAETSVSVLSFSCAGVSVENTGTTDALVDLQTSRIIDGSGYEGTATVSPGATANVELFSPITTDDVVIYVLVDDQPVGQGTVNCAPIEPTEPTLKAVDTGDCTFNVLWTGDERPQLDVSLKGKRVLQTILSDDTEPGVVSYIIDAAGAPTKGKKANIYTVFIAADNGLRTTVNVLCT